MSYNDFDDVILDDFIARALLFTSIKTMTRFEAGTLMGLADFEINQQQRLRAGEAIDLYKDGREETEV